MDSIATKIEGFTIRYAEEGDVADILYYIKKLAEFENELEYVQADERTLHESLFVRKSAEVIFGVYETEKIGFGVFHRNFSTFLGRPGINLVDLYIQPSMRNRGFGREMLSYLASLTLEGNCGRLEWWVHDWNDEAKRFYTRIGAKEVEKIRVYRLAGDELKAFAEEREGMGCIGYYDALAERSFAEWFDNDALLPSLGEFISLLGKEPKVLDLGCGTGGESKRMAGLGAEVIGVDLSRKSIELARKNVPQARFLEMNILDMRFEAGSFDGVMEAGVLFHFSQAEQDRILGGIHAMLKDEGVFQSYYPEGDSERYEHPKIGDIEYSRYARRLAKEKWIGQVEEGGFSFLRELPFDIGRFKCLQFGKKNDGSTRLTPFDRSQQNAGPH